jgi:mono/diheme cytochrome c family protein
MQTPRQKRMGLDRFMRVVIAAVLILLVAACGATPVPTPVPAPTAAPATGQVSYSRDILPLFQKSCTRCHGVANPSASLNLATHEGVMKGNSSGAVIMLLGGYLSGQGSPGRSLLYQELSLGTMPQGGDKLSAADLQKVAAWTFAGAPNN